MKDFMITAIALLAALMLGMAVMAGCEATIGLGPTDGEI
jgi:hypothetical protein